jgi:hypothetical protein
MRKFLIVTALSLLSSAAFADTCALPPLQSKTLPYQEGADIAVIAGPYQFNLPEKASALLAFDGVMAVLPGKNYVSYQLVSDDSIAEMLAQFTTRQISAAAADRYVYGVTTIDDLDRHDQKLINSMRSDLHLDCNARLTHYTIGDGVQVVFQEPTSTDAEYRLLFFTANSTHLVSVKGSQNQALAILQSIKKRTL